MPELRKLSDFVRAGRDCLRGHGPMQKVPGHWALQQFTEPEGNITKQWQPTGAVFLGLLYRCTTCGFTEVVDEEADRGSP